MSPIARRTFARRTATALAVFTFIVHAGHAAHAADLPVDAQARAAPQALLPELRSTLDDQQSVAVTIYNDELALVKDARRVGLDVGTNRVALRDVSARMRPETALLRSLTSPGAIDLLEQNFDFDVLTPAKLYEKYVGRTVRVIRYQPGPGGAEIVDTAQVLSVSGGLVLRIGDRIETQAPGRIVFDDVPANLRDRPTLVTELQNRGPGTQTLELSYLTGGLSWHADYVAELNADDSALDLNGLVTLTNQSGTAYPNARLQLVAGDVNRVRDEMRRATNTMKAMAPASVATGSVAQESLFEYHLYTLARPTTLADNQTKQVALLNGSGVPVAKELLLRGSDDYYRSSAGDLGRKLKVAVNVEFANRESAHLGVPLPRGVVRVYKRDSAGNAQFIGEDRIDHTAKNETIRLHLGDAFDVSADKKQTDFRIRGPSGRAGNVVESAYEIVLRNAKSEAVSVTVREPVPGDWTMLEESQPHRKVAAGTAEWKVRVAAGGATTLTYRVLVRY